MFAGLIIRAVLTVVALLGGVRLLMTARAQRRVWSRREELLRQAQRWWIANTSRPFDQQSRPVPPQLRPFLGPRGPRTDLHTDPPAMPQFVWGIVLVGIALLLALTVVAELASGLG